MVQRCRLSWGRIALFLPLFLVTLLYLRLTTFAFQSYTPVGNSTTLPPPSVAATQTTAALPTTTNISAPSLCDWNRMNLTDYEQMKALSSQPKCLWPGISVPMPISQEQGAYVVFTLHPKTNLHLAPVLTALWRVPRTIIFRKHTYRSFFL